MALHSPAAGVSRPERVLAPLSIVLLAGCGIVITPRLHMSWNWGGPDEWVESIEVLTIPIDDISATRFQTHNGRIRATGAPGGAVTITVTKKGGGETREDAAEALHAIELTQEVRDGVLHFGWRWGEHRRSGWGALVSYDIAQPPGIGFGGRTHNGRVTVKGLRGGLRLRTHNGRITAENCGGELAARTHNGPIRVAGALDRLDLRTHNGGVRAEIDGVRTINGSIRTHNGSIKLRFPDGVSTKVSCRTHNGGVRADPSLSTEYRSRHRYVGVIGDGAGELGLRTHNGGISLIRGREAGDVF